MSFDETTPFLDLKSDTTYLMTWKYKTEMTSAMEEQEVGWPLPALVVDSTDKIRNWVAAFFKFSADMFLLRVVNEN